MAAVLILSKSQSTKQVKKTTDLLRTQLFHIVQNSLVHKPPKQVKKVYL